MPFCIRPGAGYTKCPAAPSTAGRPDGGIVPSATIIEVL
jgi:hypothetical protein